MGVHVHKKELDKWMDWLVQVELTEFEKKLWINWPFPEFEGFEKWSWGLSPVMRVGMDERWKDLRYALRMQDLCWLVSDLITEQRFWSDPLPEDLEEESKRRNLIALFTQYIDSQEHKKQEWAWIHNMMTEENEQYHVLKKLAKKALDLIEIKKNQEQTLQQEEDVDGKWLQYYAYQEKRKWDTLGVELRIISAQWPADFSKASEIWAEHEKMLLWKHMNEGAKENNENQGEKKAKRL